MEAADLTFAAVARQAAMIGSREIAAREPTAPYVARISRLEPQLNASRVVLADGALAEADQADARADAGDARPLLGVPAVGRLDRRPAL